MKTLLTLMLLCCAAAGALQVQQQSTADMEWYEAGKKLHPDMDLQCWWSKKDASSTTGFVESHIPMTAAEIQQWRQITQEFSAVVHRMNRLEKRIIRAHGLTENKDCWEHIAIRLDQDFIFDSVPDNPLYSPPGAGCGEALKEKRARAKLRADGSPVKGKP